MTLLLVENVRRHYGAVEVLRDASLRIDRGDKVGVVGRNGGGKTTLLRVIEGEEAPDGGTVTVGPRDFVEYAPDVRVAGFRDGALSS